MIWQGKYVCFPLFSSAKVEISPEIIQVEWITSTSITLLDDEPHLAIELTRKFVSYLSEGSMLFWGFL